ncbi:dixin-like isoform 1-T1 [Synchiropus picturatus]
MIASLSRGSLLDEVLHGSFNEQQLSAYVSWVNSQLRRKPGIKPIANLRNDLQDGVVLTQLIEIVAGEVLEDVYVSPQNKEESRKNVEKVLQFISSRRIRMPHISAKDIVDGNLKSVMRIILALAAHFKPSANHKTSAEKGRGSKGSSNHNPLSTVALAQTAAAELATARHDASRSSARFHGGWGSIRERSVCVRALVKQYERKNPDEDDSTHSSSLSSVSPLPSPKALPSQTSDQPGEDHRSQQETAVEADQHLTVETEWEDEISETLEKEVQETRKMVSALQALLLNGSLPEDEQDASLTLDQGNADQQLIVIRGRLDQSMEEARELRRELLRCKQDVRNLQAVKDAQQQRLCTQEASILQMKQDLLRAGMTKDELNNKNSELQWKLDECTRLWNDCKKEVGQRDRLLQQLKQKLDESHQQQNELKDELQHKSNLLEEMMTRDIQHVSTYRENNGYCSSGNSTPSMSSGEEVHLLRDSLRSLRNTFRDHDPQQHTLDTLEQGIVSLIDRLHVLHTHRGRGKSPRRKVQSTESDTWSSKKVGPAHGTFTSSTKILYFTGNSPTPSMITIPKKLGEVTLKDVKAAVDRKGNYRYHFKALDPEFGTVKEEVFLDGAIVPGWEGKIVAWVEEDRGEERPL